MYKYKTIIFNLDGILFQTDTIPRGDIISEDLQHRRVIIKTIGDKLLLENGRLYDEVADMLDRIKKDGYTLCLCSNGSSEDVYNMLNAFGLEERFSVIKFRIKGLCKSQLIKQILDESACCSAIVVGERLIDYEAANDAGCLYIGVSYGYESKEYEKAGFKVQTINIDDFHNPLSIRLKDKDPVISYTNNAFDLKRLETELLEEVATQGFINKELLLLDLQNDDFSVSKRFEVDKDTIVLVEGVLLYREPIDKYFNYRIYLDISFEEVLKRAYKRDGYLLGQSVIEKYQQKYIPVQKWYIEKHKPKDRSDMLILNEDYRNPVILKLNNTDEFKIYSSLLLNIKVVEAKYYDEIKEMHLEDEVREMLGVTEIPDESYFQDKKNICYVILNKEEEFIGIVELFNLSWKNRRAELSITIKPSYRGKGYGSEAIKKILDIGFGEFGFNRVWLRVLEHNTRAIKCYKRVGFIHEGICREESLRRGQFKNQVQMSILKSEWI